MATKCNQLKNDGSACKAWAMKDTKPPRCAAHGGTTKKTGAPPGNSNAKTHGFYAATITPTTITPTTIEGVIEDLATKQAALSEYLATNLQNPEIDLTALVNIFTVHAQNASRLGRLLTQQHALSGELSDGLAGAIGQALDELSLILGADL